MVAHTLPGPRPRSQFLPREREVQFEEDTEEQKVSVAPDSDKVGLFGCMEYLSAPHLAHSTLIPDTPVCGDLVERPTNPTFLTSAD
jgi:hypothetical protein